MWMQIGRMLGLFGSSLCVGPPFESTSHRPRNTIQHQDPSTFDVTPGRSICNVSYTSIGNFGVQVNLLLSLPKRLEAQPDRRER